MFNVILNFTNFFFADPICGVLTLGEKKIFNDILIYFVNSQGDRHVRIIPGGRRLQDCLKTPTARTNVYRHKPFSFLYSIE